MSPKSSEPNEPRAIERATNSIDRAIGKQLKRFRTAVGLSLEACAGKLGVPVETIEAYERAKQRISASHLSLLATALGVHVEAFFERPEAQPTTSSDGANVVPLRRSRKSRASGTTDAEAQLLECFRAIECAGDRQLLVDVAERLAKTCCSASRR